MTSYHYSMVIQWDPRSDIYIASVPELPGCRTHGETYEEALKNILEVIEMWVEDGQGFGGPVPPPKSYTGTAA